MIEAVFVQKPSTLLLTVDGIVAALLKLQVHDLGQGSQLLLDLETKAVARKHPHCIS